MNPYLEKLLSELPEQEDMPVLDMLYFCHRELHPQDSPVVTDLFAKLSDVLSALPLRDCDRVWDLACALCSRHEQEGFAAGIRLGAALAEELQRA